MKLITQVSVFLLLGLLCLQPSEAGLILGKKKRLMKQALLAGTRYPGGGLPYGDDFGGDFARPAGAAALMLGGLGKGSKASYPPPAADYAPGVCLGECDSLRWNAKET